MKTSFSLFVSNQCNQYHKPSEHAHFDDINSQSNIVYADDMNFSTMVGGWGVGLGVHPQRAVRGKCEQIIGRGGLRPVQIQITRQGG